MSKKTEKGFLANTLKRMGLSKEQSEEIEEKLQGLGDTLDKARVLKKNVQAGRVEKAMLDGLYADIDKLMTRHLGEVKPELRDEIVATVLSSAMAQTTATDEAMTEDEMMDADLDEVMETEMMADEDEELVEVEEGNMKYKKEFIDLREDIRTVAKSLNEHNGALGGFATEFATMAETIGLVVPIIQDLQTKVQGIEKKMSTAPRRASQAPETRMSDTIAEIVKQSGDGDEYELHPTLRIPVRKESK